MHGDLTRICLASTNRRVARVRDAHTASYPGIIDGDAPELIERAFRPPLPVNRR
jgi:hypothetical protein